MLKKIKLFLSISILLILMINPCFLLFADETKNLPIQSTTANHAIGSDLQSHFIWLNSAPTGQQVYAVFRKCFELKEIPKNALLYLFADSRYILWINGKYVERGPCRFDPIAPEYDILDIGSFLKSGENVITVLTHHYDNGKDAPGLSPVNGRIMRHAPGLTARLDMTLAKGNTLAIHTDETWRGNTTTRFLPSPGDTWSSIPDRIDARRDTGDWTTVAFNDSTWENAMKIDGNKWGSLQARSIPRLQETLIEPLYCPEKSNQSLSQILPLTLATGEQTVVDAGRFVQAYTVLEFDADEGSRIETENARTTIKMGVNLPGFIVV